MANAESADIKDKTTLPQEVSQTLSVSVAYSPVSRVVDQIEMRLPAGSTVLDALQASGLLERHGLGEPAGLMVGVWMKTQTLNTPLRDQDRIEIYRPLRVDPKEARRQRYRKQTKT